MDMISSSLFVLLHAAKSTCARKAREIETAWATAILVTMFPRGAILAQLEKQGEA
jgi:hypothetical protein